MKREPAITLHLTYYEAITYWLTAQSVLRSTKQAEAILGKAAPDQSPVAAARRAHRKLGRAWREVLEKATE